MPKYASSSRSSCLHRSSLVLETLRPSFMTQARRRKSSARRDDSSTTMRLGPLTDLLERLVDLIAGHLRRQPEAWLVQQQQAAAAPSAPGRSRASAAGHRTGCAARPAGVGRVRGTSRRPGRALSARCGLASRRSAAEARRAHQQVLLDREGREDASSLGTSAIPRPPILGRQSGDVLARRGDRALPRPQQPPGSPSASTSRRRSHRAPRARALLERQSRCP